MSYGVTPQGFVRKRLPQIKAELEQELQDRFGTISLGPDSVFGQLVGVTAKALDDQWQAMEATYNAFYPSTASGVSLDNVAELVNVTRLPATKTAVTLWCAGALNATIPAGSQAQVPSTEAVFETLVTGILSNANAVQCRIDIANDALGDYEVRINQEPAAITGAAAGDVLAELVDAINDLDEPVLAVALSGDIWITSADNETAFTVTVGAGLDILQVTSPFEAEAVETGPVLALAETVTDILTPQAGWQSVTNPLAGVTGRNAETDAELRLRRRQSLRVIGAGSVEAIRARLLQEVQSIQSVAVYENREPTEDEYGRPGHSFEAVIEGADDDDIANAIWNLKPAGIQTFGNVTRIITDSQGDPQAIRFSRPVAVPIKVVAAVQIDTSLFPGLGVQMIREAIVDFGNALGVGVDVGVKTFYCRIFDFAGVLDIEMTVERLADDTTVTDGVLPIGQVEIATFDLANITVVPTTGDL